MGAAERSDRATLFLQLKCLSCMGLYIFGSLCSLSLLGFVLLHEVTSLVYEVPLLLGVLPRVVYAC